MWPMCKERQYDFISYTLTTDIILSYHKSKANLRDNKQRAISMLPNLGAIRADNDIRLPHSG